MLRKSVRRFVCNSRRCEEVINVTQKIGGVFFYLILLVAVLGIISFAAEFFLGKPLVSVVKETLFLISRQ
jgi:hypothetical protein